MTTKTSRHQLTLPYAHPLPPSKKALRCIRCREVLGYLPAKRLQAAMDRRARGLLSRYTMPFYRAHCRDQQTLPACLALFANDFPYEVALNPNTPAPTLQTLTLSRHFGPRVYRAVLRNPALQLLALEDGGEWVLRLLQGDWREL